MAAEPKGRFSAYRQNLAAISARTGAPLPSLILSFGILHELTAVVPLVGFFYGARALGIGERVVAAVIEDQQTGRANRPDETFLVDDAKLSWAHQKVRTWVEEGDRWAIRIGRRYGVFGYEKREPGVKDDVEEMAKVSLSGHLAGDVANAVFAYGFAPSANRCFDLSVAYVL
ncbi:hypothetical protein NLJ89_g2192 [Agrocybe chaxingu]|uniref:Uncharacterized protein n=1 Tax=Agrocybe chaxingu TaxID=84603 RepID=A0A9W8MYT4_9AGAR|nr:hypothetical protein NLJ89_g2192 [Agrocybe chaxingu]